MTFKTMNAFGPCKDNLFPVQQAHPYQGILFLPYRDFYFVIFISTPTTEYTNGKHNYPVDKTTPFKTGKMNSESSHMKVKADFNN